MFSYEDQLRMKSSLVDKIYKEADVRNTENDLLLNPTKRKVTVGYQPKPGRVTARSYHRPEPKRNA